MNSNNCLKQFSFSPDPNVYFKKYFKVYSIVLIAFIGTAIRILISDWQYKTEILVVLTIFIVLSLVIGSVRSYRSNRSTTYIFHEQYIEKINSKNSTVFNLQDLVLVDRPSIGVSKYGFDYVTLKFRDNKKLRFSNETPDYVEIKKFLKSYLYDRVNYAALLNGEEL